MTLDNLTYEFEKTLKKKQMELAMGNKEFAEHIGMHRTWVTNLYNQSLPRHPLSEKTMYLLHNILGIDFDIMVNYNKEIDQLRSTKNVG